jgi:hypothetical protein
MSGSFVMDQQLVQMSYEQEHASELQAAQRYSTLCRPEFDQKWPSCSSPRDAMTARATHSWSKSSRNSTPSRAYTFKKRKPLPGAYPRNFSPYTLTNSSNIRAVTLTSVEIRNDIFSIQQSLVREFSSLYFDEGTGQPGDKAPAEIVIAKQPIQVEIQQQRSVRRRFSTVLQAPTSEAEERRQIREAIKASRLESSHSAGLYAGRSSDHECVGNERSKDDMYISTKIQTSAQAAHLLRHVCSDQIFRTG